MAVDLILETAAATLAAAIMQDDADIAIQMGISSMTDIGTMFVMLSLEQKMS
jgi:hypothetical protein